MRRGARPEKRAKREGKAEKEKTIYIGDSEVDLATARNAGLPCISVAWGFRSKEFLEQQGATKIVLSVEELEKILL